MYLLIYGTRVNTRLHLSTASTAVCNTHLIIVHQNNKKTTAECQINAEIQNSVLRSNNKCKVMWRSTVNWWCCNQTVCSAQRAVLFDYCHVAYQESPLRNLGIIDLYVEPHDTPHESYRVLCCNLRHCKVNKPKVKEQQTILRTVQLYETNLWSSVRYQWITKQ